MNLYIWGHVLDLTTRPYNEGGIVVVAQTVEDARRQLNSIVSEDCTAYMTDPDAVYPLLQGSPLPEKVYVFPIAKRC